MKLVRLDTGCTVCGNETFYAADNIEIEAAARLECANCTAYKFRPSNREFVLSKLSASQPAT